MKTGIELIKDERERQISIKGWTPEHDDCHFHGEMIDAGLCYIYAGINIDHLAMKNPPGEWPWGSHWWKPSNSRIRNLAKAGALIAAEIDRINRFKAIDKDLAYLGRSTKK